MYSFQAVYHILLIFSIKGIFSSERVFSTPEADFSKGSQDEMQINE